MSVCKPASHAWSRSKVAHSMLQQVNKSHRTCAATLRCRWNHSMRRTAARADADVAQNTSAADAVRDSIRGVHHVAVICADLQRSLDFYCGVLGLGINEARPHDKLPYDGAWLWIGREMIHLMELPNPDPLDGRPQHGGRDRHCCIGVTSLQPLLSQLERHAIPFTRSKSGRPAVFFRDPDANTLEVVEIDDWRS